MTICRDMKLRHFNEQESSLTPPILLDQNSLSRCSEGFKDAFPTEFVTFPSLPIIFHRLEVYIDTFWQEALHSGSILALRLLILKSNHSS